VLHHGYLDKKIWVTNLPKIQGFRFFRPTFHVRGEAWWWDGQEIDESAAELKKAGADFITRTHNINSSLPLRGIYFYLCFPSDRGGRVTVQFTVIA
jgi:hypothetical protein